MALHVICWNDWGVHVRVCDRIVAPNPDDLQRVPLIENNYHNKILLLSYYTRIINLSALCKATTIKAATDSEGTLNYYLQSLLAAI